jgi:hypothetical protein
MADAGGDRNQALDRGRDVGIGETEIAGAALLARRHEARSLELGEMAACRGQRDARFGREFGAAQGETRHQRHQHVGAGGIADQGGNDRDVGTFLHTLMFAKVW